MGALAKPELTSKTNAAALAASRMETMGRLVSGVAHDFNNLLTAIRLSCDLLLRRLGSHHGLSRHARDIRTASEQGAVLTQQLLAVATQGVGGPQLLSWNKAVSATRDLLVRLIGENIELVTALAHDVGYVKMDPGQMQQVILNLVLNARDALPEGGRITLTTRNCAQPATRPRLATWVEFAVTDTGCGMSPETRLRLFEPFFTTKKSGAGNGLGLATVQRIVNQQGGSIRVESECGRGTRVVVHLPRARKGTAQTSESRKKRYST